MKSIIEELSKCPVCGKKVDLSDSELIFEYEGRAYRFCSEICLETFEKNPHKYTRPKGIAGRFLQRLARANQEQFGGKGPSCCK